MLNKVDFAIIKEIQDKADIVAVISTYIKLNRKGNNYFGVCPFHPDTNPSLVVSPKKRIFKCFVCGAKGNVFGFVQQYKKVPFIEAVRIVAKQIGFDDSKLDLSGTNTYLDPTIRRSIDANKQINEWYQGFLYNPENVAYLDYLKKRGLDETTIKYFEFGYAPKERDLIYRMASNANAMFGSSRDKELIWNEKELLDAGLISINSEGKVFDFFTDRITIPIYDNNGYLVAFSGRTTSNNNDPKYLNTSTTKLFSKANTLFNFFRAKQENVNKLIIVEGYMDVIAFYRAGYPNVVATMGVALSNEHINALSTLTNIETIILSFDNDNAGKTATIIHGQKLMENGFNTYIVGPYNPEIKDVDELLNKDGKTAIDKIIEERIDYVSFLINHRFIKPLPLDETQKIAAEIIKAILDLGDNSVLLRSKHLKLLAEKSGLEYQDLLSKYEYDLNKLNSTPATKTFVKKPFKPNNTVGLNDSFIEKETLDEVTQKEIAYLEVIIEDVKKQRNLELRRLTDGYDYLIKTIINNESLLPKVAHDLTFNTNYEFEQQDLILKSLRFLYEKKIKISDDSVLEFLKTKGEKNDKYIRAHDYLQEQLTSPSYINFDKKIFSANFEKRLTVTIDNIVASKYRLSISNKLIKIYDLYIENKKIGNPDIDKLLSEIGMIHNTFKQIHNKNKKEN